MTGYLPELPPLMAHGSPLAPRLRLKNGRIAHRVDTKIFSVPVASSPFPSSSSSSPFLPRFPKPLLTTVNRRTSSSCPFHSS
ncbi:hypothetical protein SLEP1_g50832 [Rubroshorea leprosula]|uniref:Uncharacterized protein n=1 Tax=Rubroshorea leprosula TaxID=152421 RepID=A0AAV5M195_9ROSI|nr:hypothetical protein SLEP1_g50832 [Rubroshorea leprosula]